MNSNKLETSKKKLANYSLPDLESVAAIVMQDWTAPSTATLPELDTTLAGNIRDVKHFLLNEKDNLEVYRAAVLHALSGTVRKSARRQGTLVGTFKTLLRNVLSIGTSIGHSKEALRDLARHY